MVITTSRVSHAKVVADCPEGSSLTVRATVLGYNIIVHGLYFPCYNKAPTSFYGRMRTRFQTSPAMAISAAVGEAADLAVSTGALLLVGGDFNVGVTSRVGSFSLKNLCLDNGIIHTSLPHELEIPSHFHGRASSRLDFQFHNGSHVRRHSCAPVEIPQYPLDHSPLLGKYEVVVKGPSERQCRARFPFDIRPEDNSRMAIYKQALAK